VTVAVKFLGSFRNIVGKDRINLAIQHPIKLEDFIKTIIEKWPALKTVLPDSELGYLKTYSLIFVDGKEVSVLNGLDTILKDGDEVVFIPVLHGG